MAVATFAGGCFWCVEEAFEKVPGVIRAVSGYTGGTVDKPTYEQVTTKATGHDEAVQVTYDPTKVSYPQLVDWFWRNIDPGRCQGPVLRQGQPLLHRHLLSRRGAEEGRRGDQAGAAGVGPLQGEDRHRRSSPPAPFWVAEDYHQDYYKKNPHRYQYYKTACGRAARLEQIWGPPKPPQTLTQ